MATSAEYYAQLSAQYQRELDNQAAWECALEREIETVREEAQNEDDDVIFAVGEWLSDNDEEQILHDSLFAKGDFEKLKEQRERAFEYIAEQRLKNKMDDFDPDY